MFVASNLALQENGKLQSLRVPHAVALSDL